PSREDRRPGRGWSVPSADSQPAPVSHAHTVATSADRTAVARPGALPPVSQRRTTAAAQPAHDLSCPAATALSDNPRAIARPWRASRRDLRQIDRGRDCYAAGYYPTSCSSSAATRIGRSAPCTTRTVRASSSRHHLRSRVGPVIGPNSTELVDQRTK